jgi:hypothetical protein
MVTVVLKWVLLRALDHQQLNHAIRILPLYHPSNPHSSINCAATIDPARDSLCLHIQSTCQKAHWKAHKIDCKVAKQRALDLEFTPVDAEDGEKPPPTHPCPVCLAREETEFVGHFKPWQCSTCGGMLCGGCAPKVRQRVLCVGGSACLSSACEVFVHGIHPRERH